MIQYLNYTKKSMKVAGKRILCVVLSFAIFCFSLQSFEYESYAAEKNVGALNNVVKDLQLDESDISEVDAERIADFQVDEVVESGGTDWEEGTKVKKTYPVYDGKKEICAYVVELKRGSEDAGYVVVGVGEENPPIIEFKTSGRFLDKKLQSNEYLFYDGSIDYYKVNEDTNRALNVENDQSSISVEEINSEDDEEDAITEENKNEWKAIREKVKLGGSAPPKNGGVNTSPSAYESGYTSITRKTAPDASLYSYFVMTDFSSGGVCVPTAVINLFKYYTDRKRLKTSLLLNNSWNDTFNRLKTYFKTVEYGNNAGTDMEDVKPGLDKYFKDINKYDAVTHYYGYGWDCDTADWAEMKRRIDLGEPFIYGTSEHYVYKEHGVLAVGYLQYNYSTVQASGLSTSRYLQVADGWTNHADRYININVGNDASTDEMVTLYFVYCNNLHK